MCSFCIYYMGSEYLHSHLNLPLDRFSNLNNSPKKISFLPQHTMILLCHFNSIWKKKKVLQLKKTADRHYTTAKSPQYVMWLMIVQIINKWNFFLQFNKNQMNWRSLTSFQVQTVFTSSEINYFYFQAILSIFLFSNVLEFIISYS